VSRISVVLNWLNLNLSLASLSWPLYIGGQVSRIRSGSLQITMSVYDVISYFDYIYACAYLTGPRGTKIMCLISYTLVTVEPLLRWLSLLYLCINHMKIWMFRGILIFRINFWRKLPSYLIGKYKSFTLNFPELLILHFTLSRIFQLNNIDQTFHLIPLRNIFFKESSLNLIKPHHLVSSLNNHILPEVRLYRQSQKEPALLSEAKRNMSS
jgi:hypothetical protein